MNEPKKKFPFSILVKKWTPENDVDIFEEGEQLQLDVSQDLSSLDPKSLAQDLHRLISNLPSRGKLIEDVEAEAERDSDPEGAPGSRPAVLASIYDQFESMKSALKELPEEHQDAAQHAIDFAFMIGSEYQDLQFKEAYRKTLEEIRARPYKGGKGRRDKSIKDDKDDDVFNSMDDIKLEGLRKTPPEAISNYAAAKQAVNGTEREINRANRAYGRESDEAKEQRLNRRKVR